MADHYTQFSCTLDLQTPDNLAKAMEIFRPTEKSGAHDHGWFGFMACPSPEGGPGSLWLHDDGAGDVEELIEFVQHCGRTLGLTGRWGFQYANTCSKPRIDDFGGGAHVLDLATGETVSWLSTDSWLAEILSEGASS